MQNRQIFVMLGPTNTGKTCYAIERMLAYPSGMIGLPLRLLAREVYDKIVSIRGSSVVALITGEEKIVPARTKYWICTVEAMPQSLDVDFVAVDEVQLATDRERGHIFTDRLLYSRGRKETLFLGSEAMRKPIGALISGAIFSSRKRFSELSYLGVKKISKLPRRSAIISFSIDNLYGIAELIRRQKGGAAVVLGALSPRTRNAQVALYQSGEVDFLVATDAIGMGLNLDIKHVAFSAKSKFDGCQMRPLSASEIAQIAGRAGRGMANGSFGETNHILKFDENIVNAVINHNFPPIKKLQWRNSQLSMASVAELIKSLEEPVGHPLFFKTRDAEDLKTLKTLGDEVEILQLAKGERSVELLWEVCRIPDFRGVGQSEHVDLLSTIYSYIQDQGRLPNDWLRKQIKPIDRIDGDIDSLSQRLAYIRTWTYVSQKDKWLDDKNYWREASKAIEDKLSDALHKALTKRFVDKRTSKLLGRLNQKEDLLAEINEKNEVILEGEFVGRLEGFRFVQDSTSKGYHKKTVEIASLKALGPYFNLRADRLYNSPDSELTLTEKGQLSWGDCDIAKLSASGDPMSPSISAFVEEAAGMEVRKKVEKRLQHFLDRHIATLFEPLFLMKNDENISGLIRGFVFRLIENFGVVPRSEVFEEVKLLDQEARGILRKYGVRFGQFTIFVPALLKPAPTKLRLILWSLRENLKEIVPIPPAGLVTIPLEQPFHVGYDAMAGYRIGNDRAIRIDMLERLADLLRVKDTKVGFEATVEMLSITGLTLEQFANLLVGLGYKAKKSERSKIKIISNEEIKNKTESLETNKTSQILEEKKSANAAAEEDAILRNIEPLAEDFKDPLEEKEIYYTFFWGGTPRSRSIENNKKKKHLKTKKRKSFLKEGLKIDSPKLRGKKNSKKNNSNVDLNNPFAEALKDLKLNRE